MTSRSRLDVLLLTGRPDAHEELLGLLHARGVGARCIAGDDELRQLLALAPVVVMVDLVHPPALTSEGRRALARMRGRVLLLALHDGRLDRVDGELCELPVDGYVSRRDSAFVAEVAERRQQTTVPMTH